MGAVRALLDWIDGKERNAVYLIAALTALGGALIAHRMGGTLRSMDEPAFFDVAKNLAEAGTFAHTNTPGEFHYTDRFPPGVRVPTAYQAPGYPFLLAPLALMGAGYPGMRAMNFVLVALTLIVLFHVVRDNHSPLAGLLAVLGAIAYPVVLYTAGTLYPQTLASLLLVVTVWIASSLRRDAGIGRFMLLGICAGAMALVVPTLLLIVPVIVIWLFARARATVPQLLLSCVLTATVVGVWTTRNALTFERFVPIASSAGFNLASGNCDTARYNTSLDVRFADSVYQDLTGKDEIEANRIMTRAGLDWIRSHPRRAAVLYVGKLAHWFNYSNKLLSDSVIKGGASEISSRKRDLVLLVIYGTMLALVALRMALSTRIPVPLTPFEALCGLLYIGAGLAYAIFFTRVRFRLPVDWLLIAIDAGFVASLLQRASRPAAHAFRKGGISPSTG
jgi:hypothetical protein